MKTVSKERMDLVKRLKEELKALAAKYMEEDVSLQKKGDREEEGIGVIEETVRGLRESVESLDFYVDLRENPEKHQQIIDEMEAEEIDEEDEDWDDDEDDDADDSDLLDEEDW